MADQNYSIPVWDTITTAWSKVSGTKKSVWAGIGMIFLITIGLAILSAIVRAIFAPLNPVIIFISEIIIFLLQAGLLYLGIQRAAELPFDYRSIFRACDLYRGLKVIGVYILKVLILLPAFILNLIAIILNGAVTSGSLQPSSLMNILVVALYVVGIIGVIYLSARVILGLAFVLDKDVNPWEAIKLSFIATKGNVWHLIGIYVIQFVIVAISMIPVGIGLIWTIPFVLILYGTIYKRLLVNAGK